MPKYSWKCLNKLFWLSQDSEYAWSSYKFGRPLKMSLILNKPGWRRIPNMFDYGSIRLNNAWIFLKITEHCWMSLNMPENARINCYDYTMVLSMLQYSYNNIIITVTNVIILGILSAWFAHPGALLPFYLFLTRVRTRVTKGSKFLINFSFWLKWRRNFWSI